MGSNPWDANTATAENVVKDIFGPGSDEADFSEVGEGFALIPEGKYIGRLISMEPGSTGKGDPKFVCEFEIVSPEPFAGRRLWRHAPAKGAGAGFLLEILKALDPEGDYPKGKVTIKRETYVGKTAELVVRVRPATSDYDESNDIRRVRSLPKQPETP